MSDIPRSRRTLMGRAATALTVLAVPLALSSCSSTEAKGAAPTPAADSGSRHASAGPSGGGSRAATSSVGIPGDDSTVVPASPAPPVGVELFSAAENSSGKVLGNVAGSTSLKVLVTCAKGWVTLSASPAIKTRSTCVPTGSVIAVDRIEPRPDTPLSVTLSEPQPWSVRVVAPS